MPCFLHPLRSVLQCMSMLLTLIGDALWFLWLCLHSPAALAAENLFLRKQLALYQAPNVTPRRTTNVTRCTLVWLSQWFDWQQVLTVVQPETFKRWQRQGMCLFWRWPSKPGRPPIPPELQALIRQMARDNLTWGQRRIANELRLKLGLQVSPRTVRKYMPQHLDRAPGHRVQAQRWRGRVPRGCGYCFETSPDPSESGQSAGDHHAKPVFKTPSTPLGLHLSTLSPPTLRSSTHAGF